MKKILIILFLIISSKIFATDYYVTKAGNDITGSGSSVSPYLTLTKAASVAVIGDNIIVGIGDFNEVNEVAIQPGVNITGSGTGTIIRSTGATAQFQAVLLLESAPGTNGNQTLQNFSLDGNSQAQAIGIRISGRSNVVLQNISGQNFDFALIVITSKGGVFGNADVSYPGGVETYVDSGIYATGNVCRNIFATNCSGFKSWYGGATYGSAHIWYGGQENFLIENCNLNQTQRPAGQNGWEIKQFLWSKGVTIRNNVCRNIHYPYFLNGTGDYWNFSMEIFNVQGIHIYGNDCNGSVDINRNVKGPYAYSVYFHDNIIGWNDLGSGQEHGIIIEYFSEAVIIENNTFKNVSEAIGFSPRQQDLLKDIYIRKNLAYGIGQATVQGNEFAIFFHDNDRPEWGALNNPGFNFQNFNIINNTFVAAAGETPTCGFNSSNLRNGTGTGLNILNNIFRGFGFDVNQDGAITSRDGARITGCDIRNNIFYQNLKDIYWGYWAGPSAPPNAPYTVSGNITANPLFVAGNSYALQAGSPGINAATDGGNIGHTTGVGSGNFAPTVTATATPNNMQLPANSSLLQATGSDIDGTIASYVWSVQSGPGGSSFTSGNSATTSVTGLTAGSYLFRCTVTDNAGATGFVDVPVTVTAAPPPPVGNIRYHRPLKM